MKEELVSVKGLVKVAEGIYESADETGYNDYVSKRKIRQEINAMKTQINNMNTDILEIKHMLQTLLKVAK